MGGKNSGRKKKHLFELKNLRALLPVTDNTLWKNVIKEQAESRGENIQDFMERLVINAIDHDWPMGDKEKVYEEVQFRVTQKTFDDFKKLSDFTGLTYGEIIIEELKKCKH